jgi:integrase/recombinase XerC
MLEHERRLSEHTLRGYTHELDELKKLAHGRALASLTAADMRGAVARAHGGGLSARSIAHRLSAWRAFYRWLAEHVEMQANPVATVRAPKRAKPLPKALSVDDANALMEAPQAGTPEALRDHAILELFYSSGLRLAELVGLDVHFVQSEGYSSAGWLDLASTEVNVLGKGNRRRSVPVGSKAITALRAWIEVRGQFVKNDPHALFLSVRGNRMSPNVVRERVKRMALLAGVPSNVHPHVLRHSFATHVLQSSGDLRAVQELLGHASITATPETSKACTSQSLISAFTEDPNEHHHAETGERQIARAPPSVDLCERDRTRGRQTRARRNRADPRPRWPLSGTRVVQPGVADSRPRLELRRNRTRRSRVFQATRAAGDRASANDGARHRRHPPDFRRGGRPAGLDRRLLHRGR